MDGVAADLDHLVEVLARYQFAHRTETQLQAGIAGVLAEHEIAYFLVADDGSDPAVAQILDIKRMQAQPILRPGAQLYSPKENSTARAKLLAEQVLKRHTRRLDATG